MTILDYFIEKARSSKRTVAIGLSDQLQTNQYITRATQKIVTTTQAKVYLIGHPPTVKIAREALGDASPNIGFMAVTDPSKFIIQSVMEPNAIQLSLDKETIPSIDAIIRGGLSSDYFLKTLRAFKLRHSINSEEGLAGLTYRLALLETAAGQQFFYAPVGIDESNCFKDRKNFIDNAIIFLKQMGLAPKIAILSGGRIGDIGRDPWIDQNIEEAENLVRKLNKDYPAIDIKHYQILIEKAITEGCNVILAPEGIAGNLIYRTLVHLGGGKSYGALYLTHYNNAQKIIIDTSRVAPANEYEGALYIATAVGLK